MQLCQRALKNSGEAGRPGAPGKVVQLENGAVQTAKSSEVLVGIIATRSQYRLV